MGGFGSPWHWLIIGIVALLLFGNRLPEVARSMGRAFKEFKRGLHEVGDDLGREDRDESPPRSRLQGPERREELNDTPANNQAAPEADQREQAPANNEHSEPK